MKRIGKSVVSGLASLDTVIETVSDDGHCLRSAPASPSNMDDGTWYLGVSAVEVDLSKLENTGTPNPPPILVPTPKYAPPSPAKKAERQEAAKTLFRRKSLLDAAAAAQALQQRQEELERTSTTKGKRAVTFFESTSRASFGFEMSFSDVFPKFAGSPFVSPVSSPSSSSNDLQELELRHKCKRKPF